MRGAAEEAVSRGLSVGHLHLRYLNPLPRDLGEALGRFRTVLVPEMNLGQLALEVERIVGRQKVRRVNLANGEMIPPKQILLAIEEK